MKTYMCAVFDSAAQCFGRPFFVPTTAIAQRSFRDEVNNKDSAMNAHAEDYTLYELAVFDDADGMIAQASAPSMIVRAKDVLNVER